MPCKHMSKSESNKSSIYTEDEFDFYANFKEHQISAYAHKMHDSSSEKNYYMINKEDNLVKVNKKFFDSHKKYVKKIIMADGVNYYSMQKRNRNNKKYEPQGLLSKILFVPNLMRDVMDKITTVKAAIRDCGTAQMNSFVIDFASIIADMWGYHSMASWGIILCRIYSLMLRSVDYHKVVQDRYNPQSFTDFSLMVAMLGLPKDIVEKLRVFQTLASSRITNSHWLLTVLRQFVRTLTILVDHLKGKYPSSVVLDKIGDFIQQQFSFVMYLGQAEDIAKLYSKYVKNSQIIFDLDYRNEVLKQEPILNDVGFIEFLNNIEFKHFKEIVMSFKLNILKYVKNFTVSSRVEPVCFVLEGPAGCRKSTFMNQLVQLCKRDNRSVYTHAIPSVEDAKDFYDDYENQEVFVMDDLGQQGLSQWRTIINFVAPVKLPLNCAAAEKKNTKFFNSDLILATTNLFSNIQSFTAKDCITSKEALFRRVHLVKFIGQDGKYQLTYNKFNYQAHHPTWENKFLDIMADVDLPVTMRIDINKSVDVKNALIWMYTIIKEAESRNKEASKNSDMDDATLDNILQEVENNMYKDAPMVPEMFSMFNLPNVPMGEKIEEVYDVLGYVVDVGTEYCASILNFIQRKLIEYVSSWTNIDFGNSTVGDVFQVMNITESFVSKGLIAAFFVGLWIVGKSLVSKIYNTFIHKEAVDDTYNLQSELGAENLNFHQTRIQKHHQYVVKCTSDVAGQRIEQAAICFLTGNYMLINDHLVGDNPIFNIYKDFNALINNHVLFNNLPFKLDRSFKNEDISVYKCDKFTVTPIRVYTDHNRVTSNIRDSTRCMYVSNPSFIMPLMNKVNCKTGTTTVTYNSQEYTYKMKPEEVIKYNLTQQGLCGSMLIDHSGNPCGHHVCGNGKEGIIKVWSEEFLQYFIKLSNRKDIKSGICEYEMKDNVKENFSGLRLFQTDLVAGQACGKSTYIPTDLHTIREDIEMELKYMEDQGTVGPRMEKAPANLSVHGKDTVVKLAEKSFKVIPAIDPKHLKYVRSCLEVLMPQEKFGKISEEETAFGGEELNPLKKDSANGYGYTKNKEDYIDYNQRIITDEFKKRIEEFKTDVISGKITIDKLLCKEALKDELRITSKVNKPRTFRVMPLHHTFLVKQYLGNLFKYLKRNMWDNGIAIGMNPYLDFDKLYQKLKTVSIVFDGDFGSYDGSAPPQLQDLIADIVMDYFEGSDDDKKVLRVLLNSMIRSWVLTREKLTLSTHSMPSGCWVTALFNSLLNRALTALCISMFKDSPTVADFVSIIDFVLGDDKIVGVPERLKDVVNALNMRKVAESLGMTYTDALKGEIVEPSKPLSQCQFLKRTFAFNQSLGKIVGTLDINTIIETLRYYSKDKSYEETMSGKLTAVQFELFLYGRTGAPLMEKIMELADNEGIQYQKFPPHVIAKTMLDRDSYIFVLDSLDKYNFIQ